jgi:hypothetical protein
VKLFLFLIVFILIQTSQCKSAAAFEMQGLISYDISELQNPPANYTGTENGLGYEFFGRLDLGPGKIESGFLYASTGITTNESFGPVKTTGSYWMIPLMYRIPIYEPFFSLGVGADYAIVGNTAITAAGTQLSSLTSGYKGNFGVEISGEATQDVGENLSIVFDARYREGLQKAITYDGVDSKYNFLIFSIGLQKRLE